MAGIESKADAQFELLLVRIDALVRKLKLLVTMSAVGFAIVIGLGLYDVFSGAGT